VSDNQAIANGMISGILKYGRRITEESTHAIAVQLRAPASVIQLHELRIPWPVGIFTEYS